MNIVPEPTDSGPPITRARGVGHAVDLGSMLDSQASSFRLASACSSQNRMSMYGRLCQGRGPPLPEGVDVDYPLQDRETLRRLGALARSGPYIAEAPLAIVVAVEKTNALLGIPAKLDVLAILPVGYSADKIGRGKKNRKPLRAIAHRGRYGQSFE